MFAAHEGHDKVAKALVAAGANKFATDEHGETALKYVIEMGLPEMAVILR